MKLHFPPRWVIIHVVIQVPVAWYIYYHLHEFPYVQAILLPILLIIGIFAPKVHKIKIRDRKNPIYGWRGYTVTAGHILKGLYGGFWHNAELTAQCNFYLTPYEEHKCEEHLNEGVCTCGIYGRKSIFDVVENFESPRHIVFARCIAYGVVAVDEDENWRASKVRIEELYLEDDASIENAILSANLSLAYDVPVTLLTLDKLLRLKL